MIEWTKEDLSQIAEQGVSQEGVEKQIERFKRGFPEIEIVAPAVPEKGIIVPDEAEIEEMVNYCDKAKVHGRAKFVPASGAASRMFKDMFAALTLIRSTEGRTALNDNPKKALEQAIGKTLEKSSAKKLVDSIEKFAFYSEDTFPMSYDATAAENIKECLIRLLEEDGGKGLGYGSKPKGVIKFHKYDSEVRTAFAEHLVEAQEYMRNDDGTTRLYVTISPEHREFFEQVFSEVKDEFEKRYGVKYLVNFTYQDKATDTISVDLEDKPFRKDDGSLLFRPGGHGALIYNLNKIEDELVFIKNIDNVSHERFLPEISKSTKLLMGSALMIRDKIFEYLKELDKGIAELSEAEIESFTRLVEICDEAQEYLEEKLCVTLPETENADGAETEEAGAGVESLLERAEMIKSKLNRPIRVCGMVKNEGEPGGGPFIVKAADGSHSLQILEGAQINTENPQAAEALAGATHFNPVEIVCCLRNYKGEKFDLLSHVDHEAGFISSKSFQGRNLKALELPGLWNGAMSDWNTAFVEVPLATFNPVKVVLDLLRKAHQPVND